MQSFLMLLFRCFTSRIVECNFVAPRSDLEVRLARIFETTLEVEPVGAHDDFFELGGHSLLATQLVSRLRDHFGISLPLKYIFRYPSPAELCSTIDALTMTTDTAEPDDDEEDFEEFSPGLSNLEYAPLMERISAR